MSFVAEAGHGYHRTQVKRTGLGLVLLSFQTLGIIYSDIGTSPLYVLNGIWPSSDPAPSTEDIIGGISAIVWALTLLPLIKYTFISLRFGTGEGEGGSFALYQGLYPSKEPVFDLDDTFEAPSYDKEYGDSTTGAQRSRMIGESGRWPLLVWALIGTALTMADGIFTPAVSVTSAVAGIAVAKPSIIQNITPISIAILFVLFVAQRAGTAKLSAVFAPISCVWFLLLGGTGIYNITLFPGIFRALDPSRAVLLFVRTQNYSILAGVLLCVTGCEAIFANLGQFNALSIQISFGMFVYPALVLAYLGQGATLIVDGPNVISNVFYNSIPGPANGAFFWITFVFAILATVIASQAMITATFSLIQQVVNMKGLPPIRLMYTSETIQGQIFIPAINWIMMIGTIIIVAVFTDLAKLTNAYGFAVATVMLSTTFLLSIQMVYVKQWRLVVAAAFLITWGFFDGLFWGASVLKVPHGAWVPLVIGVVITSVMVLWTWARRLEDSFDRQNRQSLRRFIVPGGIAPVQRRIRLDESPNDDDDALEDPDSESICYYNAKSPKTNEPEDFRVLTRIPSTAVFHSLVPGSGVPHTFIGFLRQYPALPQVVIFLSASVVPIARLSVSERFKVTKVGSVEGFYAVSYYVGFRDAFDVKIEDMVEHICRLEQESNPALIQKIRDVSSTATHITPHYHVTSREGAAGKLSPILSWARAFLIEEIYRRLATMFPQEANWQTSADEIIHVGINAGI